MDCNSGVEVSLSRLPGIEVSRFCSNERSLARGQAAIHFASTTRSGWPRKPLDSCPPTVVNLIESSSGGRSRNRERVSHEWNVTRCTAHVNEPQQLARLLNKVMREAVYEVGLQVRIRYKSQTWSKEILYRLQRLFKFSLPRLFLLSIMITRYSSNKLNRRYEFTTYGAFIATESPVAKGLIKYFHLGIPLRPYQRDVLDRDLIDLRLYPLLFANRARFHESNEKQRN